MVTVTDWRRETRAGESFARHLERVGVAPVALVLVTLGEPIHSWRSEYPLASVIWVDPLPGAEDAVDEAVLRIEKAALPSANSASVYQPLNRGRGRFTEPAEGEFFKRRAPSASLDELLVDVPLPFPSLLYLSSTGAEIETLSGARRSLMAFEVVVVESGFDPLSGPSAGIEDVLAHLLKAGFTPYDIVRQTWSDDPAATAGIQMAFVRKGSALRGSSAW